MNLTACIVCLLVGAGAGFWGRGADWNAAWARLKASPSKAGAALQWFSQLAGLVALFILIAPQFKGCDWNWPTPGPGPTPIPVDGLKVAFIIESADTLSKEHHTAIYGAATREYLNAKAKEWRVLDKDDAPTEKFWQDVLANKPNQLPAVFIANGRQTVVVPVPATGIVDLLKKYGG